MSESAIRSAIESKLLSVTDIGRVHDYVRYAVSDRGFIELFRSSAFSGQAHIRGWQIRRQSVSEEALTLGGGSVQRIHVYRIYGYLQINDDKKSEIYFNELVEDVAESFRNDRTLGGVAQYHEYLQVDVVEEREFGDIVCHYVETTLNVTECV